MALHLIIDGYNLIRCSQLFRQAEQQDLQLGRDMLVDALAAYKRLKGHRITVIFDGCDSIGHSASRQQIKGIGVIFSRSGESADAVIQRMAARERNRAVVVSSDRVVSDYSAAQGAAVIESPAFEHHLEMVRIMEQKGVPDESESRSWKPTTKKVGPRRRLPRRQRRNRRQLKKL
jgi:predicted RNA-binding protein with PIN domain